MRALCGAGVLRQSHSIFARALMIVPLFVWMR